MYDKLLLFQDFFSWTPLPTRDSHVICHSNKNVLSGIRAKTCTPQNLVRRTLYQDHWINGLGKLEKLFGHCCWQKLVNPVLPRNCEDFHYFRKPCFLCRVCTRQKENLKPFTNIAIYFWKLLINYENGQVFLKYQSAEKHLISTSTTFIITISVQTIVKYFFCLKPSGLILPWLKSGTGRSSNSLVLISKALISYTCFAPPNLFFLDKLLFYRCLL